MPSSFQRKHYTVLSSRIVYRQQQQCPWSHSCDSTVWTLNATTLHWQLYYAQRSRLSFIT